MIMESKNNKFIERLMINQNFKCAPDCIDLFSIEEYKKILDTDNKHEKDILKQIKYLVDASALSTGISAVCGTRNKTFCFNYGYTDFSNSKSVDEHTIFDLASVTKLFLTICFFKLYEQGFVDFNKAISYYSNEFVNVGNLTLYDLMHFNHTVITDKRITDTNTDEAVSLIKNSKIKNNIPTYSDIPAIILGMLFKKISSVELEDFLTKEIIVPLELKNTFWNSSGIVSENYMNYDNEYIFIDGRLKKIQTDKFQVHDQKARILSEDGKHLCGHAGLFSTANDISKLCIALLNEKIISKNALNLIGDNSSACSKQRFGFLSYVKNPSLKDSEIYWAMSGNSFAMSGFTGTYLLIDPSNNLFCFIGGNKINNKLTKCNDPDFIKKTNLCYSKNYIYKKDCLRDSLCNLALTNID